jgi:predicted TIM-barrel fold metal-dependent hydrolase
MSKIIDLDIGSTLSADEAMARLKTYFLDETRQGVANYKMIFGPALAEACGTTIEEIESKRRALSEQEFVDLLASLAEKLVIGHDQIIEDMDEADIEWRLVTSTDNDLVAELVSKCPGRFKGVANLNPFEGMKAVQKLERGVKELGLVACYASAFDSGIEASDQRYYPLYAKAMELGIPVFIYTSMNYRTDLPMDIARPLYLDAVAMAFPELRIVAECGGWPWVPEMIGVARRHQGVYINTCSHRPKYLAVPGSGWEMLMRFGNTLLQDRVVFASGADDMGLPISLVVQEMKQLPLKEKVKEKWLYRNARKLFDLE